MQSNWQLLKKSFRFRNMSGKMYLKTSLLADIMIYNLKNYLRIVRLHRHYKKPIARVFFSHCLQGKPFFIMQTNIHECKCIPWFKASMNSVAFLLLRFEIPGIINPKLTVNFTELKNKLKLSPRIFPF